MIAVRLPDETVAYVNLPPRARRAFGDQAAFKGTSVERLVEDILIRIADRNLFARIFELEEPR